MTKTAEQTKPVRPDEAYTPGNWGYRYSGAFHATVITAEHGLIAIMSERATGEEQEANVQLISQAPRTKAERDELLQACQRMATGASRTRADYPDDELFAHTIHYLKALDAAIQRCSSKAEATQ